MPLIHELKGIARIHELKLDIAITRRNCTNRKIATNARMKKMPLIHELKGIARIHELKFDMTIAQRNCTNNVNNH
jgi:hypothetical protein